MDSTVTYLAYLQMYESEKFGTELVSFEILLIYPYICERFNEYRLNL